jgi:hypothetical protein
MTLRQLNQLSDFITLISSVNVKPFVATKVSLSFKFVLLNKTVYTGTFNAIIETIN